MNSAPFSASAQPITTHKITVTTFPDVAAASKTEEQLTLPELEERIYTAKARKKQRLKLLKLATFGDQATEKHSLRSNVNMGDISGVEVDYDAGKISFTSAIETMRGLRLRAILYTSPSYVEGAKERWRILLPLSRPHPKSEHAKFVSWINGAFDGALGDESFVLSQPFYYGRVADNPDHDSIVLDGDFIDQRQDLAQTARGKATPKVNGASHGAAARSWTDTAIEAELARLVAHRQRTGNLEDAHWWETIRDITAALIAPPRSMSEDEVAAKCAPACYGGTDDPELWKFIESGTAKFGRREAPTALLRNFLGDQAAPEPEADADSYIHTFTLECPPPREFLYGRRLARRYVSATIAPGGTGKSALETVETLAMVSGKPLLGVRTDRLKVWVWNLEDPRDEVARRLVAAARHYGVTKEDVGGRLLISTAREHRLVVAKTDREGTKIMQPEVDQLVQNIQKHGVDVLTVDPFVSCHDVPENDNSAIDAVTKLWAEVAERGDCAIELVHHVRKGEKEITTESARGGSAFSDACRMVRVVNRMTKEEGDAVGVANHRLYFRTYIDKNNMAPPAEVSDWFMLSSIDLNNHTATLPGDNMMVVTRWSYPTPDKTVNQDDFAKVVTAIAAEHWRADYRAARWVGIPIGRTLGLDPDDPGHRARIRALIKYWISKKLLVEVERDDTARRPRTFIEVSPLTKVEAQ